MSMTFPGPNNPAEPAISVYQARTLFGTFPDRAPLLIRVQTPDGQKTFFAKNITLAVNEGENQDQPAVLIE